MRQMRLRSNTHQRQNLAMGSLLWTCFSSLSSDRPHEMMKKEYNAGNLSGFSANLPQSNQIQAGRCGMDIRNVSPPVVMDIYGYVNPKSGGKSITIITAQTT